MEDISTLLTGVLTFLGGLTAQKIVDQFGRWRREKQKLNADNDQREDIQKFELEKNALQFLQESLKHERETNAKAFERIALLETKNAELTLQIEIMRNALLAMFVKDLETAKRLLDSIPIHHIPEIEEK